VALLAVAFVALVSLLVLAFSTADSASPQTLVKQVLQGDNKVQDQREEVMSVTNQFMLRMGTYGPDMLDDQGQMPEYRDRVKEVITPKFATSFDKQAGTAEQVVAQAGVSREAAVLATGVSTIDSDSATVLVAGTFTDTYQKGGQQEPIPFRIEVSLVKTDGEWLVDDFSPVTGADE
jgi:hypothetical protein